MARNKGSANLSASLEVLAGAPLDAREVVPAKADLTAAASFPYKYIGLEVYVVAENKKYRLIANDPTDISSWEEVGSGGSGESIQVSVLPTASEDELGKIYEYIGATTADYTKGYFYECVSDGESTPTYSWEQRDVQPREESIQVETLPTASVDNEGVVYQFIGTTTADYINGYFYKCVSDGEATPTYSWEQWNVQPESEGQIVQVDTLPTATEDNEGVIYQYIGATTADYTNGYFYQCTSDGETPATYSWVAKSVQQGGGGDAELETTIVTNLAVGAVPSGTTLAQGMTFTEVMQKLFVTEIAPTFAFSLSKGGNVEKGESYTETLTLACSNLGSAKKIKTIAWYEGSTLKQTDTIDSAVTGSWTYTMGTATTDTTTFKAIVTYTKSDDVDDTQTKTASISFYYKKFYGGVSDLDPTEATVEALTDVLGTGKGGTYSFTVTAGRMCYAYPKSLGALTSIKDSNGFSMFNSFTRTEQTYTQAGSSVAYYRYVLTDPTTVTSFAITFA